MASVTTERFIDTNRASWDERVAGEAIGAARTLSDRAHLEARFEESSIEDATYEWAQRSPR